MLRRLSHRIASRNNFWSLSVLLFFLHQSSTPSTSPTLPPWQGWNIEGHLLAKSPSAAAVAMTLDGQINMSGSLSNSGNNVGLICDDKRICSIDNQWEVAPAACYRLRFPSNLKLNCWFRSPTHLCERSHSHLNGAAMTKAQSRSFVVRMSWEQKICPLFTVRRCQNCRVFASCYECCFTTAATRLNPCDITDGSIFEWPGFQNIWVNYISKGD